MRVIGTIINGFMYYCKFCNSRSGVNGRIMSVINQRTRRKADEGCKILN